ncbi:MAG: thermonuclease family protein [Alphaproteobacteria bacterium]|nr:thermonuclease family protein [Alphaproteobacteria bacterium]
MIIIYNSSTPVVARNYGADKVAPNSPQQVIAGRANVLDGDTLIINRVHIRLFAIDAPEMEQVCAGPNNPRWRCGLSARKQLAAAIAQQIVTCRGRAIDDYKRLVAVCFTASAGGQDIDLNQFMVAEGWAMAYRRFSTIYVAHEERAHTAKLGLWASQFMPPWEWRRRQHKPRH